MNRVTSAIENGRCVLAVSGSLLRDAQVMLALTDRAALPSMALSGPAQAPVTPITADSVARAVAVPDGVVAIVEPDVGDQTGLRELADLLAKAPNKPTVVVVSKSFNPLLFQSIFRGAAVAHHKARGKLFLRDLPMPPADMEEVEAPKELKGGGRKGDSNAPRFVFVGRDEEQAQLVEMLGSGGPIVVTGPDGVGRSLLVEHAIHEAELTRLPDVTISYSVGADTLLARIAEAGVQAGNDTLAQVLGGEHKPLEAVEAAVKTLKETDGLDGHVMVIRDAQFAMGRQGDFFRKSRLELLVRALLSETYPLRLVAISTVEPVFFRHGVTEVLRRLRVGGIKGRFLNEIFEAYHAPEFPRDKFGPFSDRTHGHPMVARQVAVEVRRRDDAAVMDDPKFMKMKDLGDTKPLEKLFDKRVKKLKGRTREALATAAHLNNPEPGRMLADLGIPRKVRMQLLGDGLLDIVAGPKGRRYRVHPLVHYRLSRREVTDFKTLEKLGELYARRGQEADEGVDRVAAVQNANNCYIGARRLRNRIQLKYPDNDAVVDSIMGLLRGKQPRYEMALQRIQEIINADSSNADAWLLKIEWAQKAHKDKERNAKVDEVLAEALDKAPVPELFHQAANWYLHKRARTKAIEVLEKAVEVMPDESRLRTRLASVLMRQGRRTEAIEQLEKAMELDPMLPDAFGLLGMVRRDEGLDGLDRAEELLREAVRLAPEDPVQIPRLVDLLLARARVDGERREALLKESRELLDNVTRSNRRSPEGWLQMARLVGEATDDVERVAWLLKKARKSTDRGHDRNKRISLEYARLDLARGELDKAEKAIRKLAEKDPSNAEVFQTLSKVLEARGLLIPAHAEMMRASERLGPNTLERQHVDSELVRLQKAIEAQAAGLAPQAEQAPSEPKPAVIQSRVIRRAREGAEEAAEQAADAASEAASEVAGAAAGIASEAAGAVEVPDAVSEAAGAATDVASEAAGAAAETASEAADTATQFASEAVDTATQVASEAVDAATQVASEATEVASEAVGTVEVPDAASEAAEAAVEATGTAAEVASEATGAAAEVASEAASTVADLASQVVSAASEVAEQAVETAEGAVSAVAGSSEESSAVEADAAEAEADDSAEAHADGQAPEAPADTGPSQAAGGEADPEEVTVASEPAGEGDETVDPSLAAGGDAAPSDVAPEDRA